MLPQTFLRKIWSIAIFAWVYFSGFRGLRGLRGCLVGQISPIYWIGNYGNFVLLRVQVFDVIRTFTRIEVTTFTRKFGVF
jgi:hypothetical protein